MFQGIQNGIGLIKGAVGALGKYPRMLVPLLICWLIYAPVLVGLKFHVPWEQLEFLSQAAIVFCAILVLSLALSWSAFVLLELIRQIEMNEEESLPKAFGRSVPNLAVALPIAISWAVIWFVLSVLEAIFSRGSDDAEEDYSAESVAKTLGGWDDGSFSGAFFDVLKKGVRMATFIIYPAIAWERLGVAHSVRKGLRVAKSHKAELATGFILTQLAATVVFLPPSILFLISGKFGVSFPDMVWFGTMVYCAFAWSFSLFLEQMFVAELYLWHLIWEREADECRSDGRPGPRLEDVKRPSVMDNVADLLLTRVAQLASSSRDGQGAEDGT